MSIKPIRTDDDNEAALRRIDQLWNARENTPESDEFAVLVELVCAYEARRFPFPLPDPISAIQYRMKELRLQPSDMTEEFGDEAMASQIMSRKISLTLPIIRRLVKRLGLPLDVLVQEYALTENIDQ